MGKIDGDSDGDDDVPVWTVSTLHPSSFSKGDLMEEKIKGSLWLDQYATDVFVVELILMNQ